jgi:signal transduction histidine kinase
MTMATIAFTAAFGAMSFALTTTVMAWRMRQSLTAQLRNLKAQLSTDALVLGELDAATGAFEEAYLAVENDVVRLVWGEEALKACAQTLGLDADEPAPNVLEALADTSREAAKALRALMDEGKSCRFEVLATQPTPPDKAGPSLLVEGKASGATAWIRLAIATHKASLPSGPFAAMADSLPAPCWIVDAGARLVWANKAFLVAIEGRDLAYALAHNLGLDRSSDALVAQALETGGRQEGFRWLTIEGQRRAFQVTVEPLSEGHVCAYALDVTHAEESREALRQHAKAHDETLDLLEDAVAIFGAEKRLSFHNRAFENLWDLDSAWLAERPTHAELLERLRQKRRLPEMADFVAFKARELEFYGLNETAPDEMWSLPNGRSLRIVRQPHPLGGLLLLFSDKTDEFKLKAQFNSLIQVQKATLDQLNDAITVFGSDGRLRLCNASFERFWAVNPEDMTQAMDFDALSALCLALFHDRNFWQDLKARITDTDPLARAPQTGEINLSDGRLAQWRTQPLPDGASLIVFNDITATRKLEQAIVARDVALNESVRLKRDFVANVSYELRTPLTTIVGYADLLQMAQSGLDERGLGYVSSIAAAAHELARSIDDVLDMAQIDAGEMTASLSTVGLSGLIDQARQHHEEALLARNVSFDATGSAIEGEVWADPRRLLQIFDHLIGNAVRGAAQNGQIIINARKEDDALLIDVSHTGRGIPFHVQAHIFDRYIGRERGGPGLGMALVKALVELHDGWITLESEPNKGATFSFSLPNQLELAGRTPSALGAGTMDVA